MHKMTSLSPQISEILLKPKTLLFSKGHSSQHRKIYNSLSNAFSVRVNYFQGPTPEKSAATVRSPGTPLLPCLSASPHRHSTPGPQLACVSLIAFCPPTMLTCRLASGFQDKSYHHGERKPFINTREWWRRCGWWEKNAFNGCEDHITLHSILARVTFYCKVYFLWHPGCSASVGKVSLQLTCVSALLLVGKKHQTHGGMNNKALPSGPGRASCLLNPI